MTEWQDSQATFRADGVLVDADTGVPIPRPEHKVCENTYHAYSEELVIERRAYLARRKDLHEAAMIRRRKRKKGGPR